MTLKEEHIFSVWSELDLDPFKLKVGIEIRVSLSRVKTINTFSCNSLDERGVILFTMDAVDGHIRLAKELGGWVSGAWSKRLKYHKVMSVTVEKPHRFGKVRSVPSELLRKLVKAVLGEVVGELEVRPHATMDKQQHALGLKVNGLFKRLVQPGLGGGVATFILIDASIGEITAW